MILNLHDLAYLMKVYEAVKSDNPPQLTTECPECGETPQLPEMDGNAHIFLTTHIPGYWEERGDYGQPNPYGMKWDDAPFVLIGCQGYHLVQF